MRRLRQAVLAISLAIASYLGAAFVGSMGPSAVAVEGAKDQQILLVAGPIHYDILMPLNADTRAAFDFLADAGLPMTHPDAAWVAVGWGSEAFYTATGDYTDLDLRTVWKAATGDTSVLRFEVIGPIATGGKIRPIDLTARQLAQLRGQVLAELARDLSGAPIVVQGAQLSDGDVFFRASARFSLIRTCNVWVSDVLRAVGVPMGRWTPTPYAVTLSLRRLS